MRLVDLPKDIRNIVIDRVIEFRNVNFEITLNDQLNSLFFFNATIETAHIWNQVCRGNYKPFYDFHKIEDFPRVVMVDVNGRNNYHPRVVFKKVDDMYIYWIASNIEDSLTCINTIGCEEKYVMEVTDYIEKYGNTK